MIQHMNEWIKGKIYILTKLLLSLHKISNKV